jgi:Domain of unknown function (DUF6438)
MRIAVCLFFLSFGLLSSAQSNTGANDFSITLERGGCEGICPWYGITILNDGSVRYEGKFYVHVKGVRRKKIPVSDVSKLIQKLRDEDFLHWEEKTEACVDYPDVRITANLDGQRKRLLEGCLEPGKVLTLADELDTISDTKSWVGNVREELLQKHSSNH